MSILATDDICMVRCKAMYTDPAYHCYKNSEYTYAIVVRFNRDSARIRVLDKKTCIPVGSVTVKHSDLQVAKSRVRQRVAKKIAHKRSPEEPELNIQADEVLPPPPFQSGFTSVINLQGQDGVCDVCDGLKVVRNLEINRQDDKSSVLTLAFDAVTNFNCTTGESAIVNAANTGCLGGGGVDGIIGRKGGIALARARHALPTAPDGSRCATGDAKTTEAGDLPCDFVIHTVGPEIGYNPPHDADLDLLASAYKSAMREAADKKLTAVAFCLISAGIFRGGCSLEEVVKPAFTTIAENVYPELKKVYICAFTEEEQRVCLKAVDDIKAELGDHGE